MQRRTRTPDTTKPSRGKVRYVPAILAVSVLLATACGASKDETTAPSDRPAETTTTDVKGAHAEDPAFAGTLRPVIEQELRDNAIPGAVVLIDKGGEGRWVESFGTATVGTDVPPEPTDYFRVGSNTKTMTATVILQLVEEGEIGLDDPVAKYHAGVPNGDTMTIAQLLAMRSGLPNYTDHPSFLQDPLKAWQPEELLALSFAKPVNFAPGAEFEYSNTNYILLGLIIEQVTRCRRRRCSGSASSSRSDSPTPRFLRSATTRSRPPPPWLHVPHRRCDARHDQVDARAAGRGLRRHAAADRRHRLEPVARLDRGLRDLDRRGHGGVHQEARGRRPPRRGDPAARLDSIQPIDPARPNGPGYGLGLARISPNLIGHDGQIPGFTTLAVHDPAIDLTVVILTNLYELPTGSLPIVPFLAPIVDVFYG